MKNKYMTFVALAAAALATSCTTDDLAGQNPIQNQSSSQTVTLTASVDEEQTRVGMTKNGSNANFYWHKGDAISVLSGFSLERLYTEDADGTTTAEFTGNVTGTVGPYALYPYNEKHKVDVSNFTVTYNLPATYTYNKVDGNIFSKDGSTYPSNSTNMPMYGTITNGSISFKHVGGLAVIRIDKMPAASGTLTVTADQQLSGDFKIDRGNRIIATTATDVDDDKKVTFTFSGATKDGVGVFYLPLATGTYTNVKVAIGDTEGDYGSVNISRGGVTAISFTAYDGDLPAYKGKLVVRKYSDNKYYLGNYKYLIDNQEFVDLGLPGSLLWATMNVGAESETDCGTYYNGNEAFYASADWDSFKLPNPSDFGDLVGNCTWNWTSKGGVNGYEVTGSNGQSIFLPAAGYENWDDATEEKGQKGYYWSSDTPSFLDPNPTYLKFDKDSRGCVNDNDYDSGSKYSIRQVTAKP